MAGSSEAKSSRIQQERSDRKERVRRAESLSLLIRALLRAMAVDLIIKASDPEQEPLDLRSAVAIPASKGGVSKLRPVHPDRLGDNSAAIRLFRLA